MSQIFKKLLAIFTLVSLELVVLAGVAIVSVIIFSFMAKTVFIDQDNSLDKAAFLFAESHTTAAFTRFMRFITFFASKDFLIYSSLSLTFFFLFFKQHRWYSLKIPVIAAGSSLLNQFMKFWFDRPRPENVFFEQPGFSFPSGHAMIGGAFYGLLIYWAWIEVKPLIGRWLLILLLSSMVVLIGYSRIYLHVHYATDVLAGWSAGFIFLITCLLLLQRVELRFARKAPIMVENNPTG